MALNAESVKAVAIKYQTDSKEFISGNKKVANSLDKTQKKFSGFTKALTGLFAGAAALGGIVSITKAANKQEDALKQLEDRIRSTKGAAGLTAEELIRMSKELQNVTRFGDEATQEAQAMLLTFTKIGKDVFPDVIERIQDVSTVMRQDLKASTVQLGKALNDPVANLGALSRTGIQFSKEQKETIKTLASTNRLAEAQGIILAELETQFGGAARAAGGTFPGKLAKLSNAYGDLQEEMGKGITQNEGVNDRLDATIGILQSPELAGGLQSLISGLATIAAEAIKIITFFPRLIGGLKELAKQSEETFGRAARDAEQFSQTFERQFAALENAGVSFEKIFDILDKSEGADRVGELKEEIDKLNDVIAESDKLIEQGGPLAAAGRLQVAGATDELNKAEVELNDILSKQISELVKNADAYGITNEQVVKYRENLRGQLKETVDAIPPTKKLGKAVGGGGKSAGNAAKEFKEWAAAAKAANIEIPELKESSEDLDDALRDLLNDLPPVGSEIEGVATHTQTWQEMIEELKREKMAEEAAKQGAAFLNTADSLSTLLDGMFDLVDIGGDAAKSMKALSQAANSLAKGDYFGAIVSGAGLVVDLFSGTDGIQDSVQAATALLQDFGITGSDAIQEFADQLSQLDWNISELIGFEGVQNELNQMAEDFALESPEFISKETLSAIDDLQKLVDGGADSIEDLGNQVDITNQVFNNLLRGGMDAGSAISELDSVIAKLEESAGNLGVTGNETLNKLKEYRKLIADNKALVDSVQGLTAVFDTLGKTGTFDPKITDDAQKNFDDFVDQALAKYQDLIDAGFDQGQALDLLNPIFNEINKNAEDFGLTVSDSAKDILDLASPGTFDPLVEGIDRLTEAIDRMVESFSGIGNLTPPQLSDFTTPGFDFGNIPGNGMAGTQGGGSTVVNNYITNVQPGAISAGAVQTNVEARADVNDVKDIINSNANNILRDLKEGLESV